MNPELNIIIEKKRTPSLEENEIVKYVSQFMRLSEAETNAVIDSLNPRAFKKGAFLLKEGQIVNLCYFILKGCVRQYYLVDGTEKTTHFYTEGQPITPYQGTHKKSPAQYYLVCIEDCIISVGSPEDEQQLYNKFPRLEKISRIAVEEELAVSQEALATFILKSPTERYLDLLENRPELMDRVPHYQLASYLGITPESLSRIRKRITKK
jgi:CRP-like cAMP-binding protein